MFKRSSVLIGVAALLAACASAPSSQFANTVQAAQAAGRPLVVYSLQNTSRVSGIVVNIGFINTSDHPIEKVDFVLTPYNDNNPVRSVDGNLVHTKFTATGPFSPDSSHLSSGNARLVLDDGHNLGGITGRGPFINCVQLAGMRIHYTDGVSEIIGPAEVQQYLAPNVPMKCTRARNASGQYASSTQSAIK